MKIRNKLIKSIDKSVDEFQSLSSEHIADGIIESIPEIENIYLLKKYMKYVKDLEGVDFVSYIPSCLSEVKFTKQEISILKSISNKL
jgi:ribosomal protein S2